MIIKNKSDIKTTLAHNSVPRKALIKVGDLKSSVQTVNDAFLKPEDGFEPHTHHDCEEIYYFLSGAGKMTINNKTFLVKKGDLIVVEVNEAHGLKNDGSKKLRFITIRIKI